MVYGSVNKSNLIKLDRIQSQALRICGGACLTSPVTALQVEMGEMPLQIRREQLIVSYWANLSGQNENHPTKKSVGNMRRESVIVLDGEWGN